MTDFNCGWCVAGVGPVLPEGPGAGHDPAEDPGGVPPDIPVHLQLCL